MNNTNKMTKKEYTRYVEQKSRNSKLGVNIFKAFVVGGLICVIGQIINDVIMSFGANKENAATITSIILIFTGALLTGLNLYDNIGKFAGAGSAVPITGFANSIVSPAIEFKSEGYILGVGARMFVIAGPVLVYGITSSIIYGIIYFIINA